MTAETVPAGATVKPRLTGGQRVTAALAGILGFLLHSIGWALITVALGLVTALNLVKQAVRSGSSGVEGKTASALLKQVDNLLTVSGAPLIVIGVVGAALWVVALFVSRGILRRGGHLRPWAITWAGLGIGIIMSWILGALLAVAAWITTQVLVAQAARGLASGSSARVRDALKPLGDAGVVFGLIALVLVILIGWIAWSWMAHALRPTVQRIAERDARERQRIESDQARLESDRGRHEDQAEVAAREHAEQQRREADEAERRAAAERAEADRATADRATADRAEAERAEAERTGAPRTEPEPPADPPVDDRGPRP